METGLKGLLRAEEVCHGVLKMIKAPKPNTMRKSGLQKECYSSN